MHLLFSRSLVIYISPLALGRSTLGSHCFPYLFLRQNRTEKFEVFFVRKRLNRERRGQRRSNAFDAQCRKDRDRFPGRLSGGIASRGAARSLSHAWPSTKMLTRARQSGTAPQTDAMGQKKHNCAAGHTLPSESRAESSRRGKEADLWSDKNRDENGGCLRRDRSAARLLKRLSPIRDELTDVPPLRRVSHFPPKPKPGRQL